MPLSSVHHFDESSCVAGCSVALALLNFFLSSFSHPSLPLPPSYHLKRKFKSLKRAFQFFDFNCNNSLAFVEFVSGFGLLFPKIWPDLDTFEFLFGASVEDVYHAIDDDDSGSIDMREFIGRKKKVAGGEDGTGGGRGVGGRGGTRGGGGDGDGEGDGDGRGDGGEHGRGRGRKSGGDGGGGGADGEDGMGGTGNGLGRNGLGGTGSLGLGRDGKRGSLGRDGMGGTGSGTDTMSE